MSARLRVVLTTKGKTRHIASPLTGRTLCGRSADAQRTNKGVHSATACIADCATCAWLLRQGWAS